MQQLYRNLHHPLQSQTQLSLHQVHKRVGADLPILKKGFSGKMKVAK